MTPAGLESVASPALLFDLDAIEANLREMLRIVDGDTSRLRHHAKTHKCLEILEMQKSLGIDRVKCATIAEAELAARAGITDILLSFPAIGPTVDRLDCLARTYPDSEFSTLVDSPEGLAGLSRSRDAELGAFLDLDIGMHRTGIAPGPAAIGLVRGILDAPGLRWAGVHAYDGHIHDADLEVRISRFQESIEELEQFLESLEAEGLKPPTVVSGGSPTFAMHAVLSGQAHRPWECSPGTTVLWDAGYGEHHPDLDFQPAAFLLTRVVSHPGAGSPGDEATNERVVCLDLGHKAVAAENPLSRRVRFPGAPEHEFVSQSEEHLVLRVADLESWPIGKELLGIPYHVCPSVALHSEARLIRSGRVQPEPWAIAARDRSLGC